MLSGQVPFPSPSLPEKLFGHQAVEPMPLAKLVPGIPEGLSEVVEKMMRKSPDDRYPTPLDVAQALEPYTDTPAGTMYAGPGSSAVRGGGRSAMTETQVVDAPRMVIGPAPPVTQVATRLVDEAPTLPISARSSSTATKPSPAAGTGSTSRSNENWGDLGLGIDLGPEPSLTEGLQSGKKKSRLSSSGISEVPEPAAPLPRAGGNGPDAGEPGGPRRSRSRDGRLGWSTSAPSRRCRLTPRPRPRPRRRARAAAIPQAQSAAG